eukprot:2119991-Alexandrium_andersonii.AAC.1
MAAPQSVPSAAGGAYTTAAPSATRPPTSPRRPRPSAAAPKAPEAKPKAMAASAWASLLPRDDAIRRVHRLLGEILAAPPRP